MDTDINVLVDISVRIAKAYTNFKKSPKERVTVEYVETRLESLESLWEKFSTRHLDLIQQYSQVEIAQSVYGTELVYDVTDDNYLDYKCDLKSALSRLQPKPSCSDTSMQNDRSSSSKSSHVKLPKISIPIFTGLYTEWMSFRDLFISLIHNNNEIDDVQKLHYLKGHLKGEAEQLLRHIPITNDSYGQCWTLLKDRYNNKQYLINCILQRFFSQRGISSESSSAIKQLLDVTTETLNALKGLGIDTGTWDVIIIYIVSQRFDSESRKQWETKVSELSRIDKLPNMSQFREFLETKYHSLEYLDTNSNHGPIQRTYIDNINHSNQISKSNPIHMLHVAQLTCVYCKGDHHLRSCREFINTDLNSKRNFVQGHGLCFNCLRSNHSVKHCKITASCQICNRRHHSLLHPKGENQPAVLRELVGNQVAPITNQVKSSTQGEYSSTSTNITNRFVKGAAHQVLLATALVKAESQNGGKHQLLRALIDQGSQVSFITKAAVQSLGLKTTPTKGLLSGLGGEQHLKARSMVQLAISSRLNSGCVIHVSAYVIEKLTEYVPASVVASASSITSWPELEHITLADPEYQTANKIDILLGAEVYSRIIHQGVIKCPSGSLIAQNTTLGWILSGQIESNKYIPIKNTVSMHAHIEPVEEPSEPSHKQKILSVKEQRSDDFYNVTITRDENNRNVGNIPSRDRKSDCADDRSRDIVLRKRHYQGRKLQKDEHLKQKNKNACDKYLEANYIKGIYGNKAEGLYVSYHTSMREDNLKEYKVHKGNQVKSRRKIKEMIDPYSN